jgi:hypothetical protein
MKGTLQYVSKDETLVKSWVVWYNEQPDGGNITFVDSLPLHPDDVNEINAWEQIFDNVEARIAANPEVEFEIKYYWDETMKQPIEVAKLISQGATCEYSGLPSVESYTVTEYPELEGTMNLCNDIIEAEADFAALNAWNKYQYNDIAMTADAFFEGWKQAIEWMKNRNNEKK